MPFKTPHGDHYHSIYGCHGATEPCAAAGLAPCSDCCGAHRKHPTERCIDSGGCSGVPGVEGVPRDAITGELLACEAGQDYDSNRDEYDAAAGLIRLMHSPKERAIAARGIAIGIAERDFTDALIRKLDLIEGEVATKRHVEQIVSTVSSTVRQAIAQAWEEQYLEQEGKAPESLDIKGWPPPGPEAEESYLMLLEAVADRIEETGVTPWLTRSMCEGLSHTLGDSEFEVLVGSYNVVRRRNLNLFLPVMTDVTDAGIVAIAKGQAAPEPPEQLVAKPPIQDFPQISIVNGHLDPTSYGDGFDVGDIVTYDAGWSQTIPHFAFVVRRTPKTIETIDLPTTVTSHDGYGQVGTLRPVDVLDMSVARPRQKSVMRKDGSFSIDRRWTHPWDGGDRHFDYMD